MCGIAGIVDFAGGRPLLQDLEKMAASLAHRGPDALGTFEDLDGTPAAGLAHRRLSIIDLSSAADQPLPNEDGSIQAMLNGEIYNYRALREELAGRHRFRSQGDTEVIAHGYEDEGEAFVRRLDGMFALAVWDAPRRRLLLARDHFGKKPLYYWCDGRRFVFGSEIKALLAAGVRAELAAENLWEYLAFGYVPTPRTLFRGVLKLPPACSLLVDAGGVREPRPFWEVPFVRAPERDGVSLEEAAERVGELLEAAVRKRLVADVPVGLLLSGGVDSSAVAALMARAAPGRLRTFSIGFEGCPALDERPFAERAARHVGAEHQASLVKPEAASLLGTLLHHYDEPFGDASALPTYLVAREARRHVSVALNGDGGDEVFAGYDWFFAALLADRLPAGLRGALGRAAALVPEAGPAHGALRRLRRFAAKASRPPAERLFAWNSLFDMPSLLELAGGGEQGLAARVLSSTRAALEAAGASSPLSRLLYLNARTYLLDDLLPKMDRMTMAHGLEARSPFLDRDLVEYSARLPDDFKRDGARGKIVLKRMLGDLLPPDVLRRPKRGFGLPLAQWFRSELRPLTEDLLLQGPRLASHLRPAPLRDLWREHLAGRADHSLRLWGLLTLELWLRRHRLA